MKPRFALLLLLCAAAAACTLNEILPEAPPDLRRFPRVLVLPFEDRDGLGRLYARDVARDLLALGLSPVAAEQAEALAGLRPGPGGLLSAQDLAEAKAKTQADAVLVGRVACGTPGREGSVVSFVLQETGEGKAALKDSFEPHHCGSSVDASAVAAGVAASFRREIERRMAEQGP